MKFHHTPLQDVRLIELERRGDDRGFFSRLYCRNEFSEEGLASNFVQVNNSFSAARGTLRGMHYQLPPCAEVKIVRCIKGALWDCVADMRPSSPTFGKWFGAELNENNRLMMYVPKGFAHAILTLTDNVEAIYLVDEFYAPDQERGIRWDDPWLNVQWPIEPAEISAKDAAWPSFDAEYHGIDAMRAIR